MIAPETRSVVIERQLAHPPEKVWRALTEGPLIKEWLMTNDFQPIVGHVFSFRAQPAGNWDGIIESEVLVVDPPHQLSYRWNSMGLESVVVWDLEASAGGTLLRMEHSGFRPDQEQAYRGANYGWQNFLGNLDRVIGQLD